MKVKVIISKLSLDLHKVTSATYPGISGTGFTVDEAKYDFQLNVCEILEISGARAHEIELEVV